VLVYAPDNGAGSQGGTPQQGQAPNSTTPTGQAPDGQQPGQQPQSQMVDFNAINDKGERLYFDREAMEGARSEAANYRTLYQQAKSVLEAQAAPDKDKDKGNKPTPAPQDGEAQQRLQALEARERQLTIQNAVLSEAARTDGDRKRFINPSDAVALADLSAVQIGKDGKVTGVAEALKALAESRPHLLDTGSGGGTGGGAVNPGRQVALTIDDINKMTPDQINQKWDEVQAVLKQSGA
jgi:hypothetical protein